MVKKALIMFSGGSGEFPLKINIDVMRGIGLHYSMLIIYRLALNAGDSYVTGYDKYRIKMIK